MYVLALNLMFCMTLALLLTTPMTLADDIIMVCIKVRNYMVSFQNHIIFVLSTLLRSRKLLSTSGWGWWLNLKVLGAMTFQTECCEFNALDI